MRRRLPGWIGNLFLLVVSVGLVLAACEVAARFALSSRRGKEQAEIRSYTRFDADLGWVKVPGSKVRYQRTEYDVEVSINTLGLRDRERSMESPLNVHRVLALGDSFVEAYTVSEGEMVTRVMERALQQERCAVDVVNGGTSGYSTDQELVFYRKQGRRLKPDTVVLFFYYNDILANASFDYSGRSKPMFGIEDETLFLARPAFPRREAVPEAEPPPRELPEGSAAWAWLKDRLKRGAPHIYNRLAGLGLWPPLETEEWIPDEMLVYRARYPHSVGEAWTLTELLLAELAKEVEADGARFLVVYIPARMEVRDADWDATRIIYGMGRKWGRDLVVRHLEAVGERRGFPVLDLTPALRDAESHWIGTTYFTYDGHWNALGHRVAGQAVAERLRRDGWVPCPDSRRPDS